MKKQSLFVILLFFLSACVASGPSVTFDEYLDLVDQTKAESIHLLLSYELDTPISLSQTAQRMDNATLKQLKNEVNQFSKTVKTFNRVKPHKKLTTFHQTYANTLDQFETLFDAIFAYIETKDEAVFEEIADLFTQIEKSSQSAFQDKYFKELSDHYERE